MTTTGIGTEEKKPKRSLYRRLFPIIPMVSAVVLAVVLLQCVFYVGWVPTGSMEPTIPANSLIAGTRLYGSLKTGDVVVFNHDGRMLVKRIAAGPGDVIDWSDYPQTERREERSIVPDNKWFLLGDNSDNSADARYWDDPFTDSSDIIAKVFI